MKTIDLGKKTEGGIVEMTSPSEKSDKPYYPSVYINDNKDVEGLSVGDKVMIVGKVRQVVERENGEGESCSVDIDCIELQLPEGQKKEKKKSDEDKVDEGLDEAEGDTKEPKKKD